MTIPKDKLPAPIKTAAVTNLPPPWPSQQKLTKLAETLDRRHSLVEQAWKVNDKLEKSSDYNRHEIIEWAERVQKRIERISDTFKDMQKEWEECHPASWLVDPEENRPVYSEVARMITILLGSFPSAKIPEPEIFARLLIEDVMALEPSFVELESTCRELRKTKKFMPTISEVIEEFEKQQELWDKRWAGVFVLEEWHTLLPEQIAKAKVAEEARLARKQGAEERKAAELQQFVVGARVRHHRLGPGTVTAPLDAGMVRVRFDTDTSLTIPSGFLECLIPGGDKPPAAVPMIEHRNTTPMAPTNTPDTVETVPIRKEEQDDEF